MIRLSADVPESLYQQILTLAKEKQISVEKLVEMALIAQVEAMNNNYLEERARQGSWDKFNQVLAKVPAIEPEEYDKL